MKILCLIIDHVPHDTWRETYAVHRRIWNACLDLNPDVEGYFLHADPSLGPEHAVEGRHFTARGLERYDTIFEKTRKAIEVLLRGHDHVIRTNISSLYDFTVLRRCDLSSENLYAGHVYQDYGAFVSGSGMIMSSDVAKKLLAPPPGLALSPCDDVAIGQILRACGVAPCPAPRFDYDYSRDLEQVVVGEHFHYRLRDINDPQRVREREVTEQLFAKICRASSQQTEI